MNQNDEAELRARRAAEAAQIAKYHGWKPLPIWYTFWAIVFAVGGLVSGNVGTTLTGLVIAGLLGWYVHYLYNGGKHRVWFIIF
jgi:hypothetical protein